LVEANDIDAMVNTLAAIWHNEGNRIEQLSKILGHYCGYDGKCHERRSNKRQGSLTQ
jgi:hypothetical protein|tara:strand:+ start:3557 stop:3727 length:171 start_codon:yes stop_codon:yes gene_type:complete